MPPEMRIGLGPFDELTARYQLGPLLTPQLVLDDLGSVEPVLDVTALHDDAARIPFAGSVHGPARDRIQRVVRSGAGEGALPVLVIGVVQQLVLGRAVVDQWLALRSSIEDTAIAAVPNLPIECELEILELSLGDDVTTLPDPCERSVLHCP